MAILSDETLFNIQSDVIRSLANGKSCLCVGRCADYILKDNHHLISIFLSANLNDRIRRVMEIRKITEKDARDLIEKTDKQRSSYYNYFSSKSWSSAESYHLCLNTSVLGIDETVSFIRQFATKRFEL